MSVLPYVASHGPAHAEPAFKKDERGRHLQPSKGRDWGRHLHRYDRTPTKNSCLHGRIPIKIIYAIIARNDELLGWATDLGLVFDMYKLNALKFTLRPRYDNFAGNDTTDTTQPGITNNGLTQVHVITDPFSTLGPVGTYTTATLNTFLENGKVRSYQGTRPINIYIRNPTYSGILQGATSAKVRSRWVNWTGGGQGIVYGGAHVMLNDVALTGNFNQAFDIFVTVYLQCKGVV